MKVANKIKNVSNKTIDEAEAGVVKANKVVAELVGEKVNRTTKTAQHYSTDFLSSVQNAVRAGSSSLRKDGYTLASDILDQAAGPASAAEAKIANVNPANIANQVQDFIREKPLIAIGGLAAAGFVLAAAMQKAKADLD